VGAVRLLLGASNSVEQKTYEQVEIGALSLYDRPQPRMSDYDQLLQDWTGTEVMQ